ncbi:small nuclear ribonucleoprotein B and B' [Fusarium oxysporum NRRL 32931]|uniref:Sm protein B n=2 Tax=Fusarium TaxID=5506 RepID=W9IN42_FUSOX|nr:small nuclear ribonucleoprotein B and B' [Fusarium oxysporum NRRL 32931]EWY94225.1 small nuclear ribonucleoprotein B and B' [Fusarium oxysporum NRRL 32931]
MLRLCDRSIKLTRTKQINWRMRVTLNDGRAMTGQMLAFDKHMNLVLADTEEFRRVKRKQNKPSAPGASGSATQTIESEEKRTLGLTIVRGAHIISLSVESPPPADPSARLGKSAPGGIPSALAAGPGVARPAGRGVAPPSLAGPAAGVGGAPPPGFPGFPGAPGFPGRGAPPPGFPGNFPPPAGFPGGAQFPPPGFNPGGPPPPGFQPPPRR